MSAPVKPIDLYFAVHLRAGRLLAVCPVRAAPTPNRHAWIRRLGSSGHGCNRRTVSDDGGLSTFDSGSWRCLSNLRARHYCLRRCYALRRDIYRIANRRCRTYPGRLLLGNRHALGKKCMYFWFITKPRRWRFNAKSLNNLLTQTRLFRSLPRVLVTPWLATSSDALPRKIGMSQFFAVP